MHEEDGCGCGHHHGEGKAPTKSNIALKVAVAIAIGAILFLTACAKRPDNTGKTPVQVFEVGKIFEIDGCTVYRFYDGGYPRYFSKCTGAVPSNTGTFVSTKHHHEDQSISTSAPESEYVLESSRITQP